MERYSVPKQYEKDLIQGLIDTRQLYLKGTTSGAEFPTADTIPLNDITVSRSDRFGVITIATLFTQSPKLVQTLHATATVTR